MSQFSDMANAFDRESQRPEAAQETEDVFKVLQAATTPVNPNPRRFVEPREDRGMGTEESGPGRIENC